MFLYFTFLSTTFNNKGNAYFLYGLIYRINVIRRLIKARCSFHRFQLYTFNNNNNIFVGIRSKIIVYIIHVQIYKIEK